MVEVAEEETFAGLGEIGEDQDDDDEEKADDDLLVRCA